MLARYHTSSLQQIEHHWKLIFVAVVVVVKLVTVKLVVLQNIHWRMDLFIDGISLSDSVLPDYIATYIVIVLLAESYVILLVG